MHTNAECATRHENIKFSWRWCISAVCYTCMPTLLTSRMLHRHMCLHSTAFMAVSKYFLVSLIHNNSIQTQISKFRNMPFQRCIKCITSTSVEDIDKLEIRCSDRCGSHTRYISVRDHFKSPVLHSREDPLKVAFIDLTFKSILVTINTDSKLHAILLSIQCKCIQNSPDQ